MKRTVTISLRVTKQEYDALKLLASAQSVPVSPTTMLHHILTEAIKDWKE